MRAFSSACCLCIMNCVGTRLRGARLPARAPTPYLGAAATVGGSGRGVLDAARRETDAVLENCGPRAVLPAKNSPAREVGSALHATEKRCIRLANLVGPVGDAVRRQNNNAPIGSEENRTLSDKPARQFPTIAVIHIAGICGLRLRRGTPGADAAHVCVGVDLAGPGLGGDSARSVILQSVGDAELAVREEAKSERQVRSLVLSAFIMSCIQVVCAPQRVLCPPNCDPNHPTATEMKPGSVKHYAQLTSLQAELGAPAARSAHNDREAENRVGHVAWFRVRASRRRDPLHVAHSEALPKLSAQPQSSENQERQALRPLVHSSNTPDSSSRIAESGEQGLSPAKVARRVRKSEWSTAMADAATHAVLAEKSGGVGSSLTQGARDDSHCSASRTAQQWQTAGFATLTPASSKRKGAGLPPNQVNGWEHLNLEDRFSFFSPRSPNELTTARNGSKHVWKAGLASQLAAASRRPSPCLQRLAISSAFQGLNAVKKTFTSREKSARGKLPLNRKTSNMKLRKTRHFSPRKIFGCFESSRKNT
ncbi:hypothetical protein GGX14DRAFT_625382 [Mycena pura]|uniref:Uncharacterized protein n=1 Tax=Mycena pura TaxID=153505 RepID=A0AAD6VE45_9AGAR|nr:hypothetical protein GGX14DRAFT_625382 [Mycena pura]